MFISLNYWRLKLIAKYSKRKKKGENIEIIVKNKRQDDNDPKQVLIIKPTEILIYISYS